MGHRRWIGLLIIAMLNINKSKNSFQRKKLRKIANLLSA